MHYFSPVPKMQLLEIIPHEGTSEDVIAAAVAMGLKQGKLPIVCKDVPGFFVNRCLGPYIDETICLILEMDNILKMDKAMKTFGFPVGPLTLADEAGVEVAFHLHENLQADLGVRVGGANKEAMKAILAAVCCVLCLVSCVAGLTARLGEHCLLCVALAAAGTCQGDLGC